MEPFKLSRRELLQLTAAGVLVLGEGATFGATHDIDERGFVSIGGIEQWVAIQGRDLSSPVIIYLHGGPAEAQSPFLREFLPWEEEYTVVNWDQRGSGKTFGRNGPATPGMATFSEALATMARDVCELAQYVCTRLAVRKVILVGQSWGAVLGLAAVRMHPELFCAFVGTAQPVSWKQSIEATERWARQQASADGDQAALHALDDAATLPISDMRRVQASRKYRMSPSDLKYLEIQHAFLGDPPLPDHGDVADWMAGTSFTFSRLAGEMLSLDIRRAGMEIPVPFFVIQGRDDHVVGVEPAQTYLAEAKAPRKAFVAIDGGHYACFTNLSGFLAALRHNVRPLAPRAGQLRTGAR
jgi:pimeloyl-ACP methyl ester carboxylesterase